MRRLVTLIPKRREPCILFLDDGFDCPESYEAFNQAGFSIERFQTHFSDEKGKRLRGVLDPSVIELCSARGWLLVTTDWNMEYTHTDAIRASTIAVLATTSNNDPIDCWVKAIIKARARIERDFKKKKRPYFSRISKDTVITRSETLDEHYKPRNKRTRIK